MKKIFLFLLICSPTIPVQAESRYNIPYHTAHAFFSAIGTHRPAIKNAGTFATYVFWCTLVHLICNPVKKIYEAAGNNEKETKKLTHDTYALAGTAAFTCAFLNSIEKPAKSTSENGIFEDALALNMMAPYAGMAAAYGIRYGIPKACRMLKKMHKKYCAHQALKML